MYDGDATTLNNSLRFGYDSLVSDSTSTISVQSGDDVEYDSYNLLKAPFVVPGYLSITKQYKSLESSGQILAGSPIEVKITLKNVSQKNMSNIILLERFADYLSVSDMKYDLVFGTKKETRSFLEDSSQSNSGIADIRDILLTPGSSLSIVYTGSLRAFSFGQFDVGYLEDKNDPVSIASIEKDKIKTINASALKLESIPEKDFYNHDVYGDIRFNPNETCGGPLLLWRSHNTFDRTYHKTVIVRDIADPDKQASQLGENPTQAFDSNDST
ncbi:hypothetical protein H6768_06330 [Candidatus Peribacteria bacterium]|nr:hypothetical protein [Candidatus Peribacteria bacterium]